jgi:hypothetical protein
MPTSIASPKPIPDHALAAFAIALSVEHTWQEAAKETSPDDWQNWAEGSCVEASIQLRDELVSRLDVGAVFVWGEFIAGKEEAGGMKGISHAWVEIKGGVILDVTAGQFFADSTALRMVFPGSWLFKRYEEIERDPEWAQPW